VSEFLLLPHGQQDSCVLFVEGMDIFKIPGRRDDCPIVFAAARSPLDAKEGPALIVAGKTVFRSGVKSVIQTLFAGSQIFFL
jgi:hypothetical protein